MADEACKPRRAGRKPVDDPKLELVSTRLRPSEYQRLKRVAHQYDQSLSSLVRRLILLRLP